MNFALPEDEVKEERGGAQEKTTRTVVKNKRTTTTTGGRAVRGHGAAVAAEEEGACSAGMRNEARIARTRRRRSHVGRGDGDRVRFIGEFKRTRTLDITQRSPDVD